MAILAMPSSGAEPRRIEQIPAAIKIGLEHHMEILRHQIDRIGRNEARRNADRTRQRDPQMREVAADAGPQGERVIGGRAAIAAAGEIVDIVVDPLQIACTFSWPLPRLANSRKANAKRSDGQ